MTTEGTKRSRAPSCLHDRLPCRVKVRRDVALGAVERMPRAHACATPLLLLLLLQLEYMASRTHLGAARIGRVCGALLEMALPAGRKTLSSWNANMKLVAVLSAWPMSLWAMSCVPSLRCECRRRLRVTEVTSSIASLVGFTIICAAHAQKHAASCAAMSASFL